jgi:hypothetical protein
MWHAWVRREKCRVLMGTPEGRRALGSSKRRWEDVRRMDSGEIVWKGVDWILLDDDRDRLFAVVYKMMNLRVLAPRVIYYRCCKD